MGELVVSADQLHSSLQSASVGKEVRNKERKKKKLGSSVQAKPGVEQRPH